VACGSHATPGRDDRETPMTSSVLSYFEEYFTPDGASTIAACSFAYLPTYSEGQVGTLLEAIHLGCVPITTLASRLPEEVLAHCIIVESGDIDGQRRAIRDAATWSDDLLAATRGRLRQVAGRLHDWARFEGPVGSLVDRLAGVAELGVNG
jgi:glycosyltransferase involved in cell wall biosynthesis